MKSYKVLFLVTANDWGAVKKLFKETLNVTKDKQDDTTVSIEGHFIVEVVLNDSDLSDSFYKKVKSDQRITILSDGASDARSEEVLRLTGEVEKKLREVSVYAYKLAATYHDIMKPKHKIGKSLSSKKILVDKDTLDPTLAFFDFGELIEFLGKDGNVVDDEHVSDDIVKILETCNDFEEFKAHVIKKFKRLTVWEIIGSAVLENYGQWSNLKERLVLLRDKRNAAAHLRIVTPADLKAVKLTSKAIIKTLKKKQTFDEQKTQRMQKTFDEWNNKLITYENEKNKSAYAYYDELEQRFTRANTLENSNSNLITDAYEKLLFEPYEDISLSPFSVNVNDIPSPPLSINEELSPNRYTSLRDSLKRRIDNEGKPPGSRSL